MKKRIVINNRRARLLAMSLALGAGMTILGGATVALAADNNQEDSSRFTEKMKNWQENMSETFRDTWKGLWHDKDAKSLSESSIATASVDLREQQNNYTVRLNLPDRNLDKVEVAWTGDTLRIVAPAEGKAGRYEQDIRLDGVPADAKPTIERKQKDNLVVVTVLKSPALAGTRPLFTPAPWIVPLDAWDRDML
jgi:HSP20 family molecular chaperone IbpA